MILPLTVFFGFVVEYAGGHALLLQAHTHQASDVGRRAKTVNANTAALRSVDLTAVEEPTPEETLGVPEEWRPDFHAPRLTPRQFLFISSTSQNKVVYTELKNFKTTTGRTFPLIDSGLSSPSGISFDREHGHLYIADAGSLRIFRYSIRVDDSGSDYKLVTEGPRLTIVEGYSVEWVEVNINGDLLFSDVALNTINKIKKDTLDAIASGAIAAGSLQVVSEKQQEATSAAQTSSSIYSVDTSSTAPPYIYSLYEGSINAHVKTPAGVSSDGRRLFWANQEESETNGGAIRGEVDPESPVGLQPGGDPAPFPSYALANTSGVGYGVAKSGNLVFFASQIDSSNGVVYGVSQEGGSAVEIATGLKEPRGLVWDRDYTVFVADQAQSAVFSFPSGRSMRNAPLTKAVEFSAAYGVALLSDEDEAFHMMKSSARPAIGVQAILVAVASVGVISFQNRRV